MATSIVYFRLSKLEGIKFWSVFLDEILQGPTGLEYRFLVEKGVPHRVRIVYSGDLDGSFKAEVIDHGKVIAEGSPKIPPNETHSYDWLDFTVDGDSQ